MHLKMSVLERLKICLIIKLLEISFTFEVAYLCIECHPIQKNPEEDQITYGLSDSNCLCKTAKSAFNMILWLVSNIINN